MAEQKASDVEEATLTEPQEKAAPTFGRRAMVAGIGGGVIAGAAAGFAGGFYFPKSSGRRKPRPPQEPAFIPIAEHSPRKGPTPAKVTIVELTDFQCPFCDRCRKTIDTIMEEHPEDVGLVVMHKPLEIHDQADEAAAAFQAARRQNKAWDLYPILFENRKQMSDDELASYAEKAGLDVERFKADMKSPDVLAEVAADQALAAKLGVTSTPTSFINGVGIRGAKGKDTFDKVVDDELEAVEKLIAEGVPLAEVYEKRCKANVEARVRVA